VYIYGVDDLDKVVLLTPQLITQATMVSHQHNRGTFRHKHGYTYDQWVLPENHIMQG
jgi:hypothetical protein